MSTAQALSSSRSVFKGAFQGTAIYSIPLLGQRVASICILAIVTRVLTTADFGMVSLLEQVSSVLSILLCGTFSSALGYFYYQSDSQAERNKAVGTSTGGALLLGVLAAAICWPAMGYFARHLFRSEEAMRYLPFVFLCLPASFVAEALMGWLRVEDRQIAFALLSLLRVCLMVGGIGILVGILKWHVMAYVVTSLAAQTLVSICLGVYLFRQLNPSFSLHDFKGMLSFSVPLEMGMFAMFIINFGDQFVLRYYRSLAEVGIYALGYRIGMIVSVVYGALATYWYAQVYRIMRREDGEAVFSRLLTYAVLLIAFTTLALTVGAAPGLHILVQPAFREAAALVPLIALANAVRGVAEFLRGRFLAAGRPGYEAWCSWVGMVVCVALYFLLIPSLGKWGGVIATLATFTLMFVISVIWTYRLQPYHVEGRRLLKIVGLAGFLGGIYFAVPSSSLVMQICWSALLLAMFPVGLWMLRFPTPGELQTVKSLIQRFTTLPNRAAEA